MFKDELLGEGWYQTGLRELEVLVGRTNLPDFVVAPKSAKEEAIRQERAREFADKSGPLGAVGEGDTSRLPLEPHRLPPYAAAQATKSAADKAAAAAAAQLATDEALAQKAQEEELAALRKRRAEADAELLRERAKQEERARRLADEEEERRAARERREEQDRLSQERALQDQTAQYLAGIEESRKRVRAQREELERELLREKRELEHLAAEREALRARRVPSPRPSRKRSRSSKRSKPKRPRSRSERRKEKRARSPSRKRSPSARKSRKDPRREPSRKPSRGESRRKHKSGKDDLPPLPPRPTQVIPGLTTGQQPGDYADRRPGIFGHETPAFKTQEILAWTKAQIAYADAVRERLRHFQKKEKAKRLRRASRRAKAKKSKKSKKKGSSSSGGSSSAGSTDSDSCADLLGTSREEQKFRLVAKEHPGIYFASVTADARTALGQLGVDLDFGSHGPIYRKWWDHSFLKKVPASVLKPHAAELNMLVTAMDEYHAGRVVEVGDILASRLRMLTAALEKGGSEGAFRLTRHFLVYHTRDLALCPDSLYDEAMKIESKAVQREKNLATAMSGR
jgi:hypothetical protein